MKNIVKKGKFFLLLFIATSAFGQSIKKLNDPSIVAQHKRMTFESWGDWRPYPKYFLGIQTNFAYATVWGMWAPSINSGGSPMNKILNASFMNGVRSCFDFLGFLFLKFKLGKS